MRTLPVTRLAGSLGVLLVATGTVATTTAWLGATGASEGNAAGTGTIALTATRPGGTSDLVATALRPGGSRTVEQVVRNSGTLPSTVYLRPRPATIGAPLARALKLEVERCAAVGCASAVPVYAARLGEGQCQELGALGPGDAATYRLTLRWPANADDADLYGTALTQPLRWILRTGELAPGCDAPLPSTPTTPGPR